MLFPHQTFLDQILYICLHVLWFEIWRVSLSRLTCVVDQEFLEIPFDVRGSNWRVESFAWITNECRGVWTLRLGKNEIIFKLNFMYKVQPGLT